MTETYLENRPTLMFSMGPAAYNKTNQMKVEDEDSTFFNSKFSQLLTRKPINGLFLRAAIRDLSVPRNEWKHKIC